MKSAILDLLCGHLLINSILHRNVDFIDQHISGSTPPFLPAGNNFRLFHHPKKIAPGNISEFIFCVSPSEEFLE